MPTTYNPEEIARAKHLVALAEQINTRLNRRLPRLVSCSYLMNNKYVLLDTQSASWSIPSKIISFCIVSPHEDGTPTITLSNGVVSSTISSSNFSFYFALTVPNNVNSFTMTISLPQTDTFQAWQKTVNVNTNLAARNATLKAKNAWVDGAAVPEYVITNLSEFSIDISQLVSAKSNTRWTSALLYSDQSRGLLPPVNSPTISSDAVDFTANYTLNWFSSDAVGAMLTINYALHIKVARDIVVTFTMPADDTYAAFTKTVTIHVIDSSQGG